MQIFKNRPLSCAACVFAVANVLIWEWGNAEKLILLAIALIALAVTLFLLIRKRLFHRLFLPLLCLSALLAAVISSYLFFNLRYPKYQSLHGTECQASGYVLERIDHTAFSTQLRVRLTELNGEKTTIQATVECEYASALQVGDCFSIRGEARRFVEDETFDEKEFYLPDGCMMAIVCHGSEDCALTGERTNDIFVWSSRLKTALGYRLQRAVGLKSGGLSAALLLGDRSYLSPDTSLDFRRAGVSHLLALSGLHVSILIGFVEFLLKLLWVPKRVRAVAVPLMGLGYVALTGFAPSTWRAVLMIGILYLGFLLRENYDSFTALSVVLAAILLVTPYAVLDLSLWLSFLAAGAIVIFSPAAERFFLAMGEREIPKWLLRPLRGILGALFIGLVTNLALLLISAFCFGEISLMSIPVTVLCSVPVTMLIWGSALCLCFPWLTPAAYLCSVLERVLIEVCDRVSSMEHILLPMTNGLTMFLVAVMTAVLILFAVCRIKRRRHILALPILCAAIVVCAMATTHLPRNVDWKCHVISSKLGDVRLYTRHGVAVAVNDTVRAVSLSYDVKKAATAHACGELDDLVFLRYYNQGTYLISDLSTRILVRRLHLPMPSDAREEAIAQRLSEEAMLHGIEVLYDAENFLLQYEVDA